MFHELKPYPDYHRTPIAWLGQLPAPWQARRLKHLFREVDRRTTSGQERLLSLRMQAGLVDHLDAGGEPIEPSDLIGFKQIKPAQLVMNRMRAASGLFAVATAPGLVSPDYAVFDAIGPTNLAFYLYLFKTPVLGAVFRAESKGLGTGEAGFLRLYTDRFGNIQVPLPPPEEQAAIVLFLDHADRRIRRYIAAKRKLITLLNEQRQAIIHRAVSRGLERTPSIERTDNDWFPELPTGWQVLPLRRVIRRAVDGPHHSPQYHDSGVMFISARNIKADRWSLDDAKFISQADFNEFSRRVQPVPGDVLYTKGGTTGVARAVDLEFPFQVWVHVAVLKIDRSKIDPRYLAFALNSPRCYEQSQLLTKGATNQDLGLGRMKTITLPIPPLDTQRAIVQGLEGALAGVRSAVLAAEQEIDLARELRTSLIAQVVTGKADIREAAKTLPDISNEQAADVLFSETCLSDEEEDEAAISEEAVA